MSTEALDAQIKTRVPQRMKEDFERIAALRHLEVSDIVREALRDYLARKPADQPELGLKAPLDLNGKKVPQAA